MNSPKITLIQITTNNFINIIKIFPNSSQHMLQRNHSHTTPTQPLSPKIRHSISLNEPLHYHNIQSQKLHELFQIPQLKTNKLYQKTIRDVVELLAEFDKFTDHLDQKVDFLLAKQQGQFVDSYKQHMKKVQNQFKIMQQEVHKQHELIKYYENQGQMSNLVKKVAMLQQQSKKLYQIIAKKDKEIKSLKLQNKVQKEQTKRLLTQIKQRNKAKNEELTQIDMSQLNIKDRSHKTLISIDNNNKNNSEQLKFFTTQINQQRSIKKDLSITTVDNKKVGFSYNLSQKSMLNPQPMIAPPTNQSKLQKQLSSLAQKHKRLTKINSRILEQKNELQNIFIKSVAQIKRQITIKKKIKQCTFQDFKKQDKINLLLVIISNQDILRYVYEKIFGVRDVINKQYSTIVQPIYEGNRGIGSKSRAHSTAKNKIRNSALPYI